MAKWQVSKKKGKQKKYQAGDFNLWCAAWRLLVFCSSCFCLGFQSRITGCSLLHEEVGPHFFGHGIPGRLSSVIDFNEKIVYYNLIICNVNEN